MFRTNFFLFIFWAKWWSAAELVSQFNRQIRVEWGLGGRFKPSDHTEFKYVISWRWRLWLWGLGPPFFGPTCGMGPQAAVCSVVFGRTCSSINFLDSEGLTALNCLSPRLPEGTTTHSSQNKGNDFDFLPVFTHNMTERMNTFYTAWLRCVNSCQCVRVCMRVLNRWAHFPFTALHQSWCYVKGKYAVNESNQNIRKKTTGPLWVTILLLFSKQGHLFFCVFSFSCHWKPSWKTITYPLTKVWVVTSFEEEWVWFLKREPQPYIFLEVGHVWVTLCMRHSSFFTPTFREVPDWDRVDFVLLWPSGEFTLGYITAAQYLNIHGVIFTHTVPWLCVQMWSPRANVTQRAETQL